MMTQASHDKCDSFTDFCATGFNKDQNEKSNVSLEVQSHADDDVVLCSVDGNVKNEVDENKNTNYEIDLASHENMDNVSVKDAILTHVSDSSDEEFTPKKSNRWTFMDNDFPNSDELRDILKMSYPKPAEIDSFTESASEYSNSEDESCKFLRRFWNKTKPAKLPTRVITRQRRPNFKLLSGGEVNKNNLTILKSRYLTKQEDQIDEDVILENIKRLKSFIKTKTEKYSENHESTIKGKTEIETGKKPDNKSKEHMRQVKVKLRELEIKRKLSKIKSFTRKKPEEDSLNTVPAFKPTTRSTRAKRKENNGNNTQKKCSEKKNKKPDHKRKPCEGRRSKRQQKVNEKNKDTIKAPISMHRSKPKQTNEFNVESSSSESPKRSLVDDSGVPISKRTRSHNKNTGNRISNTLLRPTLAMSVKDQYVHLSAFRGKEHTLVKYSKFLMLLSLLLSVPRQ